MPVGAVQLGLLAATPYAVTIISFAAVVVMLGAGKLVTLEAPLPHVPLRSIGLSLSTLL